MIYVEKTLSIPLGILQKNLLPKFSEFCANVLKLE